MRLFTTLHQNIRYLAVISFNNDTVKSFKALITRPFNPRQTLCLYLEHFASQGKSIQWLPQICTHQTLRYLEYTTLP